MLPSKRKKTTDDHRAAYVHHIATASAYESVGRKRKARAHRERALAHRTQFGAAGPEFSSNWTRVPTYVATGLLTNGLAQRALGYAGSVAHSVMPSVADAAGPYVAPVAAALAAGCVGLSCARAVRTSQRCDAEVRYEQELSEYNRGLRYKRPEKP